jgi:hypothetical protein
MGMDISLIDLNEDLPSHLTFLFLQVKQPVPDEVN